MITPLLIEQVPTFSWLPRQDKYLLISEKLPHAKIILNTMKNLTGQALSSEDIQQVTQDYLNALTVAFFKVYIAQDQQYRPYLQPNYTHLLTIEPFNLFLVQDFQSNGNFPILNQQESSSVMQSD